MKKIIIILALFIFIASMGCVSAFDNSTVLIPIGPDQGDFNELQGIIDNVGQGDSISLTKDFYNVENGSEISIINKTIAIDGNGHTLNASFESRIFNIDEDSAVYLSNIKFTGGYDNYRGGAIYSDGQLVLSNCEFSYNAGYFGGAVYSRNSLQVYNSVFDTNYADSGAALYSLGELMVENSVFMNNYAEYSAGAIFCLRADTVINASQFTNNDAEYYGGSVHGGQILSISDSMFTSTNDAVEMIDYYCTRELPDAYLYLENNFMDSPCPYSIYYESLNPIVSPVTLEYANKATAEGIKTEVAKIYDDMGNIIRYNDNFTMEIYGEGTLVEEVALSYDEEMGGYFYLCDLGDGTYTLTGTLPNQFAENLTVIDGELIVENSTVKMPSEVQLICNMDENEVMLMALISPFDATGFVKFRVNDDEYYGIVENSSSILYLSDLASGYYTASAIYEGDYMYGPSMSDDVSFFIGGSSLSIAASDVDMVYKDGSAYMVQLVDAKGNPVAKVNHEVNITIVGKTYSRLTDKNGVAKLTINLGAGTYPVTAQYGDVEISNVVTVKLLINASDLNMTYKDGSAYRVQLIDANGNPVAKANQEVNITIVNHTYTRLTDKNGVAKLTINLGAGKYPVTAQYGDVEISNVVYVYKLSIAASDVNMTYKDGSAYKVQLIDNYGNPYAKANEAINITIVGRTYTRLTDNNGVAKLTINLGAGTYPVTAEYNNKAIQNTVTVNKKI